MLQISDGVLEMRLVPLCHTVEHRGRVTAEHDSRDLRRLQLIGRLYRARIRQDGRVSFRSIRDIVRCLPPMRSVRRARQEMSMLAGRMARSQRLLNIW